jgi:hypothetical protein
MAFPLPHNDFWKPIKAYWANKTAENAAALIPAFRLEAIKWQ